MEYEDNLDVRSNVSEENQMPVRPLACSAEALHSGAGWHGSALFMHFSLSHTWNTVCSSGTSLLEDINKLEEVQRSGTEMIRSQRD